MLEAKNVAANSKIIAFSYAQVEGVFSLAEVIRFNLFKQVCSCKSEHFTKCNLAFCRKLMSKIARVSNIARPIFEQ